MYFPVIGHEEAVPRQWRESKKGDPGNHRGIKSLSVVGQCT